jgi:transcriptional regulator with XRE-family HTH domain
MITMDERIRIEKIMEAENLSSGIFAGQIGVQNSTLSHILNNRNKPSLDVLKKILQRYPEISSDWLILGQGPMYREERKSQSPSLFDNFDLTTSKTNNYGSEKRNQNDLTEDAKEIEVLKSEPEPPYGSAKPYRNINAHIPLPPQAPIEETSANNKTPENQIEKSALRKVIKIILYYSDHTFEEFQTK